MDPAQPQTVEDINDADARGNEEISKETSMTIVMDPEKTGIEELEQFFIQLEEDLQFEKVIQIIDGFPSTEEYKNKYQTHYETLLMHKALAHAELQADGGLEKAKELYQQAIDFLPESSTYSKYFSYAQMLTGHDAINMYKRGTEVVEKELIKLESVKNEYEATMQETEIDISCESKPVITKEEYENSSTTIAQLKAELQNAFTAIGEIYVTDLQEEEGALGLAMSYTDRACEFGPTVDALLVQYSVLFTQSKNASEYPNALLDARKIVGRLTLKYMSMLEDDDPNELDLALAQKCVDAAVSVDCFTESFTIISTLENQTGSANDTVLSMWALHHHRSAVFHLKGFHHYSARLLAVIQGLEDAHEATDDCKELKTWITDLKSKTKSTIGEVEDTSSEETAEFVEMTPLSPMSDENDENAVESSMDENLDSDDDSEVREVPCDDEIEDDDDSCVIIEDNVNNTKLSTTKVSTLDECQIVSESKEIFEDKIATVHLNNGDSNNVKPADEERNT